MKRKRNREKMDDFLPLMGNPTPDVIHFFLSCKSKILAKYNLKTNVRKFCFILQKVKNCGSAGNTGF